MCVRQVTFLTVSDNFLPSTYSITPGFPAYPATLFTTAKLELVYSQLFYV